MSIFSPKEIGVVVIGRNEGARLQQCLLSVVDYVAWVVYVDSGSTDGSVAFAKSIDVEVVLLDMSKPFTAARARNEGFSRLLELAHDLKFVQFVDGDCTIVDGWLGKAVETLKHNQDFAIACGRRRERFPNASIYNKLCDMEWNTPIGEADACGGDALMRTAPLKELGGYNTTLIAGEEPELCVRFRLNGWKILRIDSEMTLHDADMHRFSQWWKRTFRAGHAYAEGNALHGRTRLRHCVRQVRSIFFWGFFMPITILASFIATWWTPWAMIFPVIGMLGYGKIALVSYIDGRKRGGSAGDALLYGFACTMGKFPQLLGALRYYINRWRGRQSSLIEYKLSDRISNSRS